MKAPTDLVSGEGWLPVSERTNFPLCPHVEEGERSPFYKVLNSIHVGSTLMTSSPPRGPCSKNHHLGVRISTYESEVGGGVINVQSLEET